MLPRLLSYLKLFQEVLHFRMSPRENRSLHAARVASRMGALNGLPQKVGQLIGYSALTDLSSSFIPLTESEAILTSTEVRAIVRKEFNPNDEKFIYWEEKGISASIGQVHRAKLSSGEEVAVKVQIPDISNAIRNDLRILKWALKVRKGFDPESYQSEIGTMLRSELDFRIEAEWTRSFYLHTLKNPQELSWLRIPKVHFECEHLLITDWIEGVQFEDVLNWSEAERKTIGERLLHLFFLQVFSWGNIHADPNPGNYRFRREDLSIGLIDFGCVKKIPSSFQQALVTLLSEPKAEPLNSELVFKELLRTGFSEAGLRPIRDRLGELMGLILEPFRSEKAYEWQKWNLRKRNETLLQEHRLAFRAAGPAEILYWIRAFQGLSLFLSRLGVPIQPLKIFDDLCKNRIAYKGKEEREYCITSAVNTMRIEVRDQGEMKVSLTYDANAAAYLSNLIPLELKEQILKKRISLEAIEKQAQENNFMAGELFHWNENGKEIRIWLE